MREKRKTRYENLTRVAHQKIRWLSIAVCLIPLLLFSALAAQDWPMFRGDARHTGFSATTSDTLLSSPIWKFQTGGAIHASPVVSSNRVFVASTDNFVYALDANNGTLLWRQRLGQWIEATPVVSHGKIIVAAMDHNVYGLDEVTGRIDWIVPTESWLEASPVAGDGLVFIAGLDGYLYALDIQTGQKQWQFDVRNSIFSSPAFNAGVLYFGVQDTLYAVDSNGRLRWKSPTNNGAIIESAPVVYDGKVLVTTIDNGVAYYKRTGEFGSLENQILAFDAATGSRLWTFTTEPYGLMHGSPAVAYDRIFVATDRGRLCAINARNGNPLWEIDVPDSGAVWSSPTVAVGVVYVATYKGHLYGFSAESGDLIGAFSLSSAGSYFHASPAIPENKLYCAGSDGVLYMLGRSSPSAVQEPVESLPKNFTLAQNHPNPVTSFLATTNIGFQLPHESHVVLKIYNLLGQEIAVLLNERRPAGLHQIEFRANKLPNGVYLYRLEAAGFTAVRKMVVMQDSHQ